MGLGSISSANDEVKPDVDKNPGEATTEQSKVLGVKTKTRTEVRTSSQQPQYWTVRFLHPPARSNH
jgi:hypothetical protein